MSKTTNKFMRLLVPLFALLLALPAFSDAPTQSEKATMDAVWTALNAQPALLDMHRSFLAYLSANPDLARALDAVRPLQRHPALRDLLHQFDDSLARNTELNAAFASFHTALASDETLHEAVDAVYRLQLSDPSLNNAFIDLLGDMDTSLLFLANPAKPAPTPLYAFKPAFKNNSQLQARLLDALNSLHKNPMAHAAILPWWQMVSRERESGCAPYIRLLDELMKQPQRFWIWHEAETVLARNPKARSWIVYFQRRVRQDPSLSQTYDIYLDIIGRRPDYAKAAMDKWDSELGPAPAWPTADGPPALPLSPAGKTPAADKKPARPRIKKPVAEMPSMPDMPAMPDKPAKPKKGKPAMAPPVQNEQ